MLEVESQRQKEFAFEGHRWFDLVRTNRAMKYLEKVTNPNQYLFPIPQAEIIANDNPGMYQNDGY
jgi:starch-binding outer membrane protein, SusD/RagB family